MSVNTGRTSDRFRISGPVGILKCPSGQFRCHQSSAASLRRSEALTVTEMSRVLNTCLTSAFERISRIVRKPKSVKFFVFNTRWGCESHLSANNLPPDALAHGRGDESRTRRRYEVGKDMPRLVLEEHDAL